MEAKGELQLQVQEGGHKGIGGQPVGQHQRLQQKQSQDLQYVYRRLKFALEGDTLSSAVDAVLFADTLPSLVDRFVEEYLLCKQRLSALEKNDRQTELMFEEATEKETCLLEKIEDLKHDKRALEHKYRTLENEKTLEIRKLNKELKEVEKQKKIIQAKDKHYQHAIKKMEIFIRKLQESLDKTRPAKITGKTITPPIAVPSSASNNKKGNNSSPNDEALSSFMSRLSASHHEQLEELESENEYLRANFQSLQAKFEDAVAIAGIEVNQDDLITSGAAFQLQPSVFCEQMRNNISLFQSALENTGDVE
eukprot:TRINITY_DN32840_c0_g1_i2.p1 TRINITY_DN32840_c0_g1~~TRINITY_DN32840_c0_g1_i2.p1  ORF type:complete len:322 (-),score=87.82 TRINITY_DN32840_c0_g1_i2:62-985(-)